MIKKTIKFEDFNGQELTEDFFFHFSKAELVELEVSEKEGFAESLKKIVAAEDGAMIIEQFKKIVLMSYGQKSEDGRRFIKTQALRDEFAQTEAYSQLFMELATSAEAASAFINGVVPASLLAQIPEAAKNETPVTGEVIKPITAMSREELIAKFAEKSSQ